MRRAAKVDANHGEVVDTFRRLGCSVVSLAPLAGGIPDLLVAHRHASFLVEVKDGSKPASARKLNPLQEEFHSHWKGQIYIVETLHDVAAVVIRAARDAEAAF